MPISSVSAPLVTHYLGLNARPFHNMSTTVTTFPQRVHYSNYMGFNAPSSTQGQGPLQTILRAVLTSLAVRSWSRCQIPSPACGRLCLCLALPEIHTQAASRQGAVPIYASSPPCPEASASQSRDAIFTGNDTLKRRPVSGCNHHRK